MSRLGRGTVGGLPRAVVVPTYDRDAVTVGVVHIGLGGFARAHLAVYLDALLEAGLGTGWGVCGVGLLPGDRRMQEVLDAQDGLFTVLVKHPGGGLEAQVVGSVVQYLYAPDDPDAVVERMADPAVRIVTMTVTEGGYARHPVTGAFDPADPRVGADLRDGAVPTSVFGLVTEALARRRARGVPPFTVLSCDNLQRSGTVARTAFAGFAALRDPELGEWVAREVAFPDAMVDRITPATTDDDRALAARELGVEDAWPVVTEPFLQWVLEDHFPAGRPELEQVGAQLVEEVLPYELMKLRLLNATHQAMAHLGGLAGHRYVDDVHRDPVLVRFLARWMEREAAPTLPPVPGVDLVAYRRVLLERFGNTAIRDTLARLRVDSSERVPSFLLPVVRAQLDRSGEVVRAALVVAAWAQWCVDGELEDVRSAQLREAARGDDLAFLRQRDLFGDLADAAAFVEAYVRARRSLREVGVQETVQLLDR